MLKIVKMEKNRFRVRLFTQATGHKEQRPDANGRAHFHINTRLCDIDRGADASVLSAVLRLSF